MLPVFLESKIVIGYNSLAMIREQIQRSLDDGAPAIALGDKVAFVQNYFILQPDEPDSARALNLISSLRQ